MTESTEKDFPKQLFQLPPTTEVSKPCFAYNEWSSEVIVYNSAHQLRVYDLSGHKKHDINLPLTEAVTTIELSISGVLAVLTAQNVMLLSPSSPSTAVSVVEVEEGIILRWNEAGTVFVVGSAQGVLFFYDLRNERKQMIVGKHSRRVVSVDWHPRHNWLLSCGEDRTISISRESGDSVEAVSTVTVTIDVIKWAGDYWVGLCRERRLLVVSEAAKGAEPQLVALPATMGRLLNFFWMETQQTLAVLAAKGALAIVSLKADNRGAIIHHEASLLPSIECCGIDRKTSELVVAGEGLARVLNKDVFDERFKKKFSFDKTIKPFLRVVKNGEVMLLLTSAGQLFCLLTHIDRAVKIERHIALRTSLDEAKFRPREGGEWRHVKHRLGNIVTLLLSQERLFLLSATGLSEFDLCLGTLISEECFEMGEVLAAEVDAISSKILLVFGGRVAVREKTEVRALGEISSPCKHLSLDHILGYVCTSTDVFVFILATGELCAKITWPFQGVFFAVNPRTTELLCSSAEGQSEYHCLHNDIRLSFSIPSNCCKLLLDAEEKGLGIVVLSNFHVLTLRVKQPDRIHPLRLCVCKDPAEGNDLPTLIDSTWQVLSMRRATLTGADANNQVCTRVLSSHMYRQDLLGRELDPSQAYSCFSQALEVDNLLAAVRALSHTSATKDWILLAERALQCLDSGVAVQCLHNCNRLSEAHLIATLARKGRGSMKAIAATLASKIPEACNEFAAAGMGTWALRLMLRAEGPQSALEMSRRLPLETQWSALRLEVADELLYHGELPSAQKLYEEILKEDAYNQGARLGRASCFVRYGNATKALEAADDLSNDGCAELALLAEESELWEVAFKIYMRMENWKGAGESALKAAEAGDERCALQLLEACQGKIMLYAFVQLGHFFETRGRADLAQRFLEAAGDAPELVRHLIGQGKLNRAEEVFEAQCPYSIIAATSLADSFGSMEGCETKVLTYLVRAAKKSQALSMAIETGTLECIALDLLPLNKVDSLKGAEYFLQKKNFDFAGKFYISAAAFEKALECFLRGRNFDQANQLVAQLDNAELFEYLSTLYQGEVKGIDADAENLFRLHLLFKRYPSANSFALDIIGQELTAGHYKAALQKALSFCTALGAKAAFELRQKLAVLHLYALGRIATRAEDHFHASLLLNAVATFIHFFPRHMTSILTSAVVEATKAGHRHIAYAWAVVLCQPGQRERIDEKFNDRVEKIALKPAVQPENWLASINSELIAGFSLCLNCNGAVEDPYAFNCPNCTAFLIRCMSSGRAILSKAIWDVVQCNSCKGLNYWGYLHRLLQSSACCPLCEQAVQVKHIPTDWAAQQPLRDFLFKPLTIAEVKCAQTERVI